MSHTAILSRAEIESMGPPLPEEIADTGISEGFLCDLALKHVAMLPEPTTQAVAEQINLPRTLAEELLQKLYREKLIEVKMQSAMGSTRYAMLDHGWDRYSRLLIDLRLRRTSASVFARLFPHDEAPVDSVQHGVDGDCASGFSRSGPAGDAAANVGLRHQFTPFTVFDGTPGHRKDCRRRTY